MCEGKQEKGDFESIFLNLNGFSDEKIKLLYSEYFNEIILNGELKQDALTIAQKIQALDGCLRKKIGMSPNMQLVSKGQQAMWFLYKMMPNSTAYNLKFPALVKDDIDAGFLKKALEILIQRHPTLRTTYSDFKGEKIKTIQTVNSSGYAYLEEKDATSLEKEEIEKYLIEKCEEPFDLEKGPMIRTYLIRVAKAESIFLLTIHHIASDLVSSKVMLSELWSIYTWIKDGGTLNLPEDIPDYMDFVKNEAKLLYGKNGQRFREYWMDKLSGDLPILSLPADKLRPKMISHRGKGIGVNVNRDLVLKVKQLASDYGATPYMIFMAIYYVLLYRYTGQQDIIIGSPAALRNKFSFNNTLGYFVNMLPLRMSLEGNPSFRQFLSSVNKVILGGLKNRKYPFSMIVDELQLERDLTRSSIFQVSFTMEKGGEESLAGLTKFYLGKPNCRMRLGGLEFQSLDLPNCSSEYELSLFMEEIDGEYCAVFQYQTDLFDDVTIKQMARHFVNILAEVVENPDKTIGEYKVISNEERERALNTWNSRNIAYPESFCIHQLIEEQALKNPETIAVSFGDIAVSYRELNEKSNQLARFLRKNGVGLGVMVPICLEPSIDMIIGVVGILKSGGAYVPLNPEYPQDRINTIFEEVEPIVVITEVKLVDRFLGCSDRLLIIDKQWDMIGQEEVKTLDNLTKPNDTAYIIYTSGSTGKPKGVMVSHYNVVRLFEANEQWYKFGREDVWTLFHSFAFDFSVWEIYGALIYGGKLVVVPYLATRSPEAFYKLISREKVTVLNQTPSAFRQLIKADEKLHNAYKLSLKYVIFGGEALELKTLEPWFERYGDKMPQLVNMYGITETTVHVTYRPITLSDLKKGSGSVIGVPIPDLQLYILDENKNIVPTGCCGEIYVGGAGVAKGYYKRDDLTKDRFIQDFINQIDGRRLYRSGDLARYLQNGDIEYMGRIDQQVKIRGFRIEIGDIEGKILDFPGVREAVVIVREDVKDDKRLTAYIVMRENHVFNIGNLRAHLKEKLPEYMLPAAFVEMNVIPMTSNGKVDKKSLPQPVSQNAGVGVEFVEPRTVLEKEIAAIWKDTLNIDDIGIENNFFDIGGNSMSIVETHSVIQDRFCQELEVVDLFQYSTIKSLADFIESKRSSIAQNDLIDSRAELRKNARLRRNAV